MNGSVIIIMGVSGCGKSTLGLHAARRLGLPFFDADDFHPANNVAKMRAGIPLNDEDRRPWLGKLAAEIATWSGHGGAVLACSALKKACRDILRSGGPAIFAHITGTESRLAERINARRHHFMSPTLLSTQLSTLEPPDDAMHIDLELSTEEQTTSLFSQLSSIIRLFNPVPVQQPMGEGPSGVKWSQNYNYLSCDEYFASYRPAAPSKEAFILSHPALGLSTLRETLSESPSPHV